MPGPGPHRTSATRPLRVVTINSHQPYLHLLGPLPHRLTIVERGMPGLPCPWDPRVRPLPPRACLTDYEEALRAARRRPFDVGVAHSVTDLLALRALSDRLVLVLHCTLTGRIAYEGSGVAPAAFAAAVGQYLARVPARVVFISELKRRSWRGLPGVVIPHGISPADYQGWTGGTPAVLRVANLQRRRDVLLNHSLQQEALVGVPNRLLGCNPDVPGAAPAASWDDLRAAYREHRCFLVTNHREFEDGYNLAVLEAMLTGMPVVTTPHPTSPIRHGEEGLVGETAEELRAHVTRLLHDHALASRLGARARRTAQELFPQAPFLAAWDRLLREAADRPTPELAWDGGAPATATPAPACPLASPVASASAPPGAAGALATPRAPDGPRLSLIRGQAGVPSAAWTAAAGRAAPPRGPTPVLRAVQGGLDGGLAGTRAGPTGRGPDPEEFPS